MQAENVFVKNYNDDMVSGFCHIYGLLGSRLRIYKKSDTSYQSIEENLQRLTW